MGERRPRVDCPKCGKDVALTPSGLIGWHKDDTRASRGYYCDAAQTMTEADVRAHEVQLLAELIAKYPDQAYTVAVEAQLAAKRDGT